MLNLLGEELYSQRLTTAELIRNAEQEIAEEYQNGRSGDWLLKVSYGKDSTETLNLAMGTLLSIPPEKRTRFIYVICSDTGVENPVIEQHMASETEKVKSAIKQYNLPMSAHIVHPEPRQSYWFKLLGLGYPLPSQSQRWCTTCLKIDPAKKFLDGIEYVTEITGVRSSESQARRNKYGKVENHRMEEKGKLHFMPILHFTVEDVWAALSAPLVWGSSLPVRNYYAKATGECGLRNPRGTEMNQLDACGTRFGCWPCGVVTKDKSTEQMVQHDPWLAPLVKWRELQMKVYGRYTPSREYWMTDREWKREQERWELFNQRLRLVSKAGYMRDETKLGDDEGNLLIEARRYLLDKLLETQEEFNELRAEYELPYKLLIPKELVEMILQQHEEDRQERPYLTQGIPDVEKAMQDAMEQVERELELPYDPNAFNLFTV